MEDTIRKPERDMMDLIAKLDVPDLWHLVRAYADFQLQSRDPSVEDKFKLFGERVGNDSYSRVTARMAAADRVQAAVFGRITSELGTRDPFVIKNAAAVIVQELVRRLVVEDGVLADHETYPIWPLAHLEDGSYVPPVQPQQAEGPGTSAIPDAFKGVFDND
jgi:hypothetical protein